MCRYQKKTLILQRAKPWKGKIRLRNLPSVPWKRGGAGKEVDRKVPLLFWCNLSLSKMFLQLFKIIFNFCTCIIFYPYEFIDLHCHSVYQWLSQFLFQWYHAESIIFGFMLYQLKGVVNRETRQKYYQIRFIINTVLNESFVIFFHNLEAINFIGKKMPPNNTRLH